MDASKVSAVTIDHAAGAWRMFRARRDNAPTRAGNVNSIDEVPDSSWFTNRIGSRPMSLDELRAGPNRLPGPAPGPLTVISIKDDGITPGLQLRDAHGTRWFVKLDPVQYPELASGAEVISTRVLYALGYNVPENYIATLRQDELAIDGASIFKDRSGARRPLAAADITTVLQRGARRPDGSYRVLASRALPGVPVGPFRYEGTRADDPNDVVAHEDRRELRGLLAFAAWLHHVDTKAQNSLDTLVTSGSRTLVVHHLLDFGSTLGSSGVGRQDWRAGAEYGLDTRAMALSLVTLGMYRPSWQHSDDPGLAAVGRIDAAHFRPDRWKPTLPNPAFRKATADDLFWAARRVTSFSDEALRAIVAEAQFSEPRASAYLAGVLIGRRDRIGQAWLTAVNPIVAPVIDASGTLTFVNAAAASGVATGPVEYRVQWALFDNSTGAVSRLGAVQRSTAAVTPLAFTTPAAIPLSSEYIAADISAIDAAHPSWAAPVRATFRRTEDGSWQTVGLERPPAR
jgi:hypothetical protein